MSLAPGQRLAQYTIVAPLGAGGMGEVWRARDTRLDREAALKVLPVDMAGDADRLRRFEREARALASLNHAHVAQVFGIDEADGTAFLAMELVEGQDLSQRLAGGALSLAETLDVVGQIAGGLEAAHEAGVVHRDLKPANVRLTPDGTVKLIDFGLAKEVGPRPDGDTTHAEPDSALVTEEGLVLGTPVYMSPEQARGQPVDRRADLWALGCVLFECLTGRRPFGGRSAGEVLAAVLKDQPDWSLLPSLPPRVDELLRRCLEKDARMRLRDAGEARVQLQLAARGDLGVASTSTSGSAVTRRGPSPALATVLVIAGLALGAALAWSLGPPPVERGESAPDQPVATRTLRFQLHELHGPGPQHNLSLAPDGSAVAWAESGSLWLRSLDTLEPRALADGVDQPYLLTWCLERRELAYVDEQALWILALEGGTPRKLADMRELAASSLEWTPDGRLAYWVEGQILAKDPDSGLLETLYEAPDERSFHLDGLAFLDGGELLSIRHEDTGDQSTLVRIRDGVMETAASFPPRAFTNLQRSGERLMLLSREQGETRWWWLALGPDGPVGEPHSTPFDTQSASFAADGTVAWAQVDGTSQARLVRLSMSGEISTLSREHESVALMAANRGDGRQQLYAAVSQTGDESTLWSHDHARGASTFVARVDGPRPFPCVLEDGSVLLANPIANKTERLSLRPGSNVEPFHDAVVQDATSDGRVIVYSERMSGAAPLQWDDLSDDLPPVTLSESAQFMLMGSRLSADGRWVLYSSKVSGRTQVHLATPDGRDWQVSLDGADHGFFGAPGDEAIYLVEGQLFALSGCTVWRVEFTREPEVALGRPEKLFSIEDRPVLVTGIDPATGQLLGTATRKPLTGRILIETGWDPGR